MAYQTMSGKLAQIKIDQHAQKYARLLADEDWTLGHAHEVLSTPDKHDLSLFAIAGLAKALACFQCSAE